MIDKLEEILSDDNGFVMKIRFLGGCDEQKLQELIEALNAFALEWKVETAVPKSIVISLIDLIPSLMSSADSYKDQQERERIYLALDRLADAIRDCFA